MFDSQSKTQNNSTDRWERLGMILVFTGLLLAHSLDPRFMAIMAIGVFGPLVLRCFPLLDYPDEFRLDVLRRAGHQSYVVVCSILASVVVARSRGGSLVGSDMSFQADVLLLVAMFVFYLNYSLGFWGVRVGAIRICKTIGVLLVTQSMIVMVRRGLGDPWWVNILEPVAIAVLFFLPAFSIRRWPRASGRVMVILGLISAIAYLLWSYKMRSDYVSVWKLAYIPLWLCLPYLVCGFNLLRVEVLSRGANE
jgi:hypothetical protein